MQLKPRFWGSTTALVLGSLCLIAGIASIQRGFGTFLVGLVSVFGALAYRSAKKTRLALHSSSSLRTAAEIAAIVLAVAAVLLQKNFLDLAYQDPVPNVLVPLWAIGAYAAAKLSRSASPVGVAAV
jgi:hypothetical protein